MHTSNPVSLSRDEAPGDSMSGGSPAAYASSELRDGADRQRTIDPSCAVAFIMSHNQWIPSSTWTQSMGTVRVRRLSPAIKLHQFIHAGPTKPEFL